MDENILEYSLESKNRIYSDKIAKIDDVVSLSIGEPAFNTPDRVKQAAIDAVKNNFSRYAPFAGFMELREEITHYLQRRYGLIYDASEQIIVTVGVTEAIHVTSLALLNSGDEVLIPTPAFFSYETSILTSKGVPVFVDTSDDNHLLTPEKLRKTLHNHPKIKYIILNYPNNPTGASYTSEELRELAVIIEEYNVYCVADEVYSEILFDEKKHRSIAEYIPERTILFNGLSKGHAMTGYRVGFMAVPKNLFSLFMLIHQSTVTGTAAPMQQAAIVALRDCDQEIEEMNKTYEERRDFVVQKFKEFGFKFNDPQGTFYLFAKIPENQNSDDEAYAIELAEKAGVALTPGSHYGPGGEGYVRISFGSDKETLVEGIHRLEDYFFK